MCSLAFLIVSACALIRGLSVCCPQRRYHVVYDVMTWDQARQHCQSNFIDLVNVPSEEEMQAVKALISWVSEYTFWLGLRRNTVSSPWEWSTGVAFQYSNWLSREPDANGECGTMIPTGEWGAEPCADLHSFVCLADLQDTTTVQFDSSQTEDGEQQSQHPSTMASPSPPAAAVTLVPEELHLISDSMVWPEAWQYCRDHYTDLVSLTSLAAQNRVSELVRNSTASRFWIGLHRTVVYDNWYWVADPQNTTTVQSDSQNSPTTGPAASQTQDGGEQSQLPSTMGSTSRASSPWHSISWLSGTSPAVTVTPVPEELHLISDSMVWPEAWQYCRDHYTDLVSLTSLAAQNRVSELVRNSTASRFWIGLHRTVLYDNWYWVAGKDKRAPLNYTNWAPGEPNNPYYEHCGEMVLGEDGRAEWNDLCCYEQLPFICFKGNLHKLDSQQGLVSDKADCT
ncbi:UNVERIFIED_CONTAM: hypothetical protein FKN15_005023 [Acipenser sinensis]